jgi:predicted phosphodiesterase
MKIAVCSDLHLEFGSLELKNPGGVDVLILSGDICVEQDVGEMDQVKLDMGFMLRKSQMIHEFFQGCCAEFPEVIYVVGNHEHYHGDYAKTIPELKRKLGYLPNLRILDKEVFRVGDVTFVGGTLWTDMNKEDDLTLYHIKSMMNDFRVVKNSNRVVSFKDQDGKFHTREAKFCPEDAVEDHRKFLEYLKLMISESSPWETFVVVGHHAPSRKSTHPRYANEQLMNGGYSSELSEFILDHEQIRLWTHGHTHEDFDYMIGQCRVVCNPRGYIGYESRANDFELKVVEL